MEKSSHGITLLETLTTLAISSILFGLAIPVSSNIIDGNRVSGQLNMLSHALAVTRSEAIARKQDVVLCKSADQSNCTHEGEWSQGYLIFVDQDGDRERSPLEQLIQVQQPLPENILLNYRAFGSQHYVAFRPTGLTLTNGTFTFCNTASPSRAKALIITKTGRVRVSETRTDGSPLSCFDEE
jgi:type IV fimbrial biogenesis protein FimT